MVVCMGCSKRRSVVSLFWDGVRLESNTVFKLGVTPEICSEKGVSQTQLTNPHAMVRQVKTLPEVNRERTIADTARSKPTINMYYRLHLCLYNESIR